MKSSKQKKISNKKISNNIRKKSLKKKKNYLSQNGGEILTFQVYFFTELPITETIKSQLMNMLIELYGEDISYTDDAIHLQMIGKILIIDWVKDKGRKYITKNQTLGFNVNTIPIELRGDMDDDKLTFEEHRIRNALHRKKLPFKLTKTPPGIWNDQFAIIAFENI